MTFLMNILNAAGATANTINTDFCSDGSSVRFIFQTARLIIRVLQFTVPFALIIWGSLDFFKAVIAGDDKEMKQKRKPFVHRVISAIIILLLPSIVNLIMKNIAKSQNSSFARCWDNADPSNGIQINNTNSSDNWSE